ncbi:hypothetical protein LPJ61_001507 [Coemansia biformis]|uniref:BED-type domain-containing protein n=1 Tax=Coemansia biformis TaxID=1286918 RepID=A0A9W7YFU7_9FUNG|nr:hypothetical protein LPJ61_001507 [Coemansia biformis]
MRNPPSDIDVDLSSEVGSEGPIDEAEASQLLRSSKVYDFGSKAHPANPRRMDFSPTPSPPPGAAGQSAHNGVHAVPTPGPLSAGFGGPPAYPAAPASSTHSANDHDDEHLSDVGSAKDDSVESSSMRNPSPPAIALGAATSTPSARSRTSIWVHFTRDPDYATNRRGRCVYCHNYYSCSSGSTGNMWRHIKRSHPEKAAHAAPLATHGTHTTPQTKAEDALPQLDSRPRKRHASMSSPVSERYGTPASAARSGAPSHSQNSHLPAQQQQHKQLQNHLPPPQQNRLSINTATRNLEDAIFSELGDSSLGAAGDTDITSADNLVHALKLLLSLSGRSHGTASDRLAASTAHHHQPTSSTSLLSGLLDNLSAARSAAETGHAAGDAAHLPRLPVRGPLASIPEDHRAAPRAGGQADSGAAVAARYHDARRGVADPESIGQFVSAISDAIRANTDAASGAIDGDGSYSDTRAQRTLRAIVNFMVRELVPVDRMLSPGMQQLVASMSQGAPVPTAAALVDELYRRKEARALELRQRLGGVRGKVSVSIGASCIAGTTHYLTVYAHWADEEALRHDALLSGHCLDGAPTSGDIMSAFESTLTQYDLFGRLGAVTTNYTREFVEFLNQVETICHARGALFDLDRNQATCVASALQDAQTKLLGTLYDPGAGDPPAGASAAAGPQPAPAQPLATPLAKLREAIRDLLVPGQPGSQQLVELCRGRDIRPSALEFDETRPWASTAQLLDQALAIYVDLSTVLDAAAPTPEEWLWLSQARALMRLVDVGIDALLHLPGEFPSIVDVVPIYDTLCANMQGLLQTPALCDGIRRSGEALRDYLAQCHPFQTSPIYRLAPLFDPRLKTAYYADRGYDQAWVGRVMREAKSLLTEYVQPRSAALDNEAGDGESAVFAQAAAGSQSGDIKAAIDAFIWLGKPAAASQLAADGKARIFRRAYASGRSELDDYAAAPLAAPSASAMAWWRVHRAAFPDLARLAGEYLSISASCCAIPSLFRRGSMPDYVQIAGLDRKLADAYICLHHWQCTASPDQPSASAAGGGQAAGSRSE